MSLEDFIDETPRFNGEVYEPVFDDSRLTGQIRRIFLLMQDKQWRTLNEISWSTGDPPASISAQLRHLRKERFGSHTVNKRARGNRHKGLWEYQLIINDEPLPNFMRRRVIFMGDTVKLKHVVPKPMWNSINDWLYKRKFSYEGNGIWKR